MQIINIKIINNELDEKYGIKILHDREIIDGNYQYIGRCLYGKFSPGVFTTNDEWEVSVSGDLPESHNIKFAQAVR